MISSMTGFGRFEIADCTKKITVELKSVNHKYLDLSFKMPRKFNAFEAEMRNLLKSYAVRGKIDIFITYESLADTLRVLKFDSKLADEYYKYYTKIRDDFELADDITVSLIARSPEVLVTEEPVEDEATLWNDLKPVLEGAFENFKSSRLKEGYALKENICMKLDDMSISVDFIEERLPQIIDAYKTKLTERVKDFLENATMDEGRIAAEVTVFADRIAVDEELVRLKAHIQNMKDILEQGGDVGRNLDFLAQEMNREANTILSKSSDIDVTNNGIELKTCIEKIREQVQNIE
ncbi:MAG: YicC/YloC family endoribonuclease [Lachnospiraceae bacterium]